MAPSRTEQLIDIVRADQTASAQRWEMAIESDDSDRAYEADAEECDEAYDEALAALEGGDLAAAEAALLVANECESRGGDNCDAHHALQAVRAAMADED